MILELPESRSQAQNATLQISAGTFHPNLYMTINCVPGLTEPNSGQGHAIFVQIIPSISRKAVLNNGTPPYPTATKPTPPPKVTV